MTPRSIQQDFSEGHLFVRVGGISDWNIDIQVFVGDASDRDGDKVVKVSVILMNEVAISFRAND